MLEYLSVFLQKWRAMVEMRFLRWCVDPNAPWQRGAAAANGSPGSTSLLAPPKYQRIATELMMPRLPIRNTHHSNDTPLLGVRMKQSTRKKLGIIRVSTKD